MLFNLGNLFGFILLNLAGLGKFIYFYSIDLAFVCYLSDISFIILLLLLYYLRFDLDEIYELSHKDGNLTARLIYDLNLALEYFNPSFCSFPNILSLRAL